MSATPKYRFPKPGERVAFWHDGANIVGMCNGEPQQLDPDSPHVTTHVPVYVHDGDRCLMVAVHNITEWNER